MMESMQKDMVVDATQIRTELLPTPLQQEMAHAESGFLADQLVCVTFFTNVGCFDH
jgi:hypothetical protein